MASTNATNAGSESSALLASASTNVEHRNQTDANQETLSARLDGEVESEASAASLVSQKAAVSLSVSTASPANDPTVPSTVRGPTPTNAINTGPSVNSRPKLDTSKSHRQTPATSSPLQQSFWTWILTFFAFAAYIITVCYAFGNTELRYLSFARVDPSNTILVLRTLSEFTALLVVALVNACAEKALWMLIAQPGGTQLPSFLALCPGSTPWNWIQLLLRNARGGRSLSWLRILIAIILPATGIILLGQVNTQLFFDDQATFPVAAGIGDFDASYAIEYAQVAATLMAADFSSLLQTNEASWGVPLIDPAMNCDPSDVFSENYCGHGYFLHGGMNLITPWPTKSNSLRSATIYTVHSIRGLQLDFTNVSPGARFQGDSDCILTGTKDNALQICFSQFDVNAISAKFIPCPISVLGSCLNDTSWFSSSGWTTTMHVSQRHATIHLSRANFSTVAVEDVSPPTIQSVSAADVLSVFNTTLGPRSSSGLGAYNNAAGQFVSLLSTYLLLAETSSPVAAEALFRLRNLLAMPLLYFQPTYLSPYTRVPSPNRVLDGLPGGNTPGGLYTTAALGSWYVGLRVRRWCVIVYAVGMGGLMISCLMVLVLASLSGPMQHVAETGPWAWVDFVAGMEWEVGPRQEAREVGGGEGTEMEIVENGHVNGDTNGNTNANNDVNTNGAGVSARKEVTIGMKEAAMMIQAEKKWRGKARVMEGWRVRLHRRR